MLHKKWVVYYDTSKQHIKTVCEQIAEPLNVEACATHGYHHESNQCVQNFFLFVMNLLTPWTRVLLEKLTGFAASQEILRIYGTLKFITVLTSSRQLSLSWAHSIQSPQAPPASW
jgi:hypothetical protein